MKSDTATAGPHITPIEVVVFGDDYTYSGWVVAAYYKRTGEKRCVVEDHYGRELIHDWDHVELINYGK